MSGACVNRMQQLLVLLAVSLSVLNAHLLRSEWWQWKREHGRKYGSAVEEVKRRDVWAQNYDYIRNHNRKNQGTKLSLNQFADMSQEEFQQVYLRSINVSTVIDHEKKHMRGNSSYPSWMDWRIKGFVTDVKNQRSCSSSWAFSATGALEGMYYKNKRYIQKLSEQQLLDCSEDYGNRGCYGGLAMNAFRYVQGVAGICLDSDYPYLAYVWQCADLFCSKAVTCSEAIAVESGSELDLLDALYNVGPISVVIDGTGNTLQFYSDGIYNSTQCSTITLNHAMLLVGYGTDTNGGDYWILKNSWGTSWGIEGYMKFARNRNNMCGIATAASYPLL